MNIHNGNYGKDSGSVNGNINYNVHATYLYM